MFQPTASSVKYRRNLCRANGKVMFPARTSSKIVEGSGTTAGLPTTAEPIANAALSPLEPEKEESVLLSSVNRVEPVSVHVEASVADRSDANGIDANTRPSSRVMSSPGSVAASCSIAAMRFSKRWPVALLIEPEAIAAWMAVNGSLLPVLLLLSAEELLEATIEEAAMAPPWMPVEGAIVTVELALIVNVFCRICVALRLATLAPSPTVVLPEYVVIVPGKASPATIPTVWVVALVRTKAPSLALPVPCVVMFAGLEPLEFASAETEPANCSVAPAATVALTPPPIVAVPEAMLN